MGELGIICGMALPCVIIMGILYYLDEREQEELFERFGTCGNLFNDCKFHERKILKKVKKKNND